MSPAVPPTFETLPTETLPAVADVIGTSAHLWQTQPRDDGLTLHVVRRPGRVLNLSAQWRLYDALVPVTTQAFGADMTPYWSQRSREGYLERLADFVLVSSPDGAMVGWTGSHVLPFDEHTVVYLDSTGMLPRWRGRGVMRSVLHERLHQAVLPNCPDDRPVYVTARSESPVFYRLMRSLLPSPAALFPHADLPTPPDVETVARHVGAWLGQTDLLETGTLAIRSAYATLDELYDELPTTGDADLDQLFRGRLGPLDAYLLVGRAR